MKDLIIQLRTMQLFAHNAHNLMAHLVFFSDHAFFADTYSALEDDYDAVVERTLGVEGEKATPLNTILKEVAIKLSKLPCLGIKENSVFFKAQLKLEQELCTMIAGLYPTISAGTQQLIGEIANQSEIRQYKIKQRITK
jgi:DNA-binding ferritin-like protein